jgi:hypothetical protein|tara:strand:- start:154 stop:543 length:390 start_codon:yes stop_codon:yes gene_type:complete
MAHNAYSKDKVVNGKTITTNKQQSTRTNGTQLPSHPYNQHTAFFQSNELDTKLSQLMTILDYNIISYDELQIAYSQKNTEPYNAVKVVNPKFKDIHSSKKRELYTQPLEALGVIIIREIPTKTFTYKLS